jgi:hypothetical protein
MRAPKLPFTNYRWGGGLGGYNIIAIVWERKISSHKKVSQLVLHEQLSQKQNVNGSLGNSTE